MFAYDDILSYHKFQNVAQIQKIEMITPSKTTRVITMKTITYSINKNEKKIISAIYLEELNRLLKEYDKNPERFAFKDRNEAEIQYKSLASEFAVFYQLKEDGLASISKEEDNYYTFSDHAGDCYDPIVNDGIPAADLKRQERNERARFNRQGVWFHSLTVLGKDLDSIGGFVGNDFYGSGYDHDFYQTAIAAVAKTHPEYFTAILGAIQ